ncbi:hypothetical protein BKA67DRAFT_533091 [Truncatella angustata]|uniref:Uncharacterized protein n=1 Tax=Truncatella angustata TaxID=152316 RepID=A0A9P8UTG7_9PEZI|nr:uncharacterized protein BKA67DRAFT_533091 [Truncatella angustata]KAH6657909.1 hypothetical protein BKA67DRAFT_533091 [Truncatella angustata]
MATLPQDVSSHNQDRAAEIWSGPSNQDKKAENFSPMYLYHVVLQLCYLNTSPCNLVKSTHVVGTYTSFSAAETAARTCFVDAGYDPDHFKVSFINIDSIRRDNCITSGKTLGLLAITLEGFEFQVHICTSANSRALTSNQNSCLVEKQLWHVLLTIVRCLDEEIRSTTIEGTFQNFEDAKEYASTILLPIDNTMTRTSFAHYEELPLHESECTREDNVLAYALSHDGTFSVVSLIKEYKPRERCKNIIIILLNEIGASSVYTSRTKLLSSLDTLRSTFDFSAHEGVVLAPHTLDIQKSRGKSDRAKATKGAMKKGATYYVKGIKHSNRCMR